MKKALFLVVAYIFLCLIGSSACGFIFMLCDGLKFFVAGQDLELFSFDLFREGVFYSVLGVCIVALILLVLYMIRHNKKFNVYSLIAYLLLGCMTWCFVFPQIIFVATESENDSEKEHSSVPLSAGYFRENKNEIFYYSKVLKNGNVDGLFINTLEKNNETDNITIKNNFTHKIDLSDSYSDVLTQQAVRKPKIINYLSEVYDSILNVAFVSWSNGKSAWLAFCSLGLALLSFYSFKYFSSWKLINSVLIIFFSAGLIFLNHLCYSQKLFEGLYKVADNLPTLSDLNNFAVYLNLLVFFVFVIFGFVRGFIKNSDSSNLSNGDE